MLADPRAEALAERFAAQWLRLQDIEKVRPDPNFYPNFDENLAEAMRTETKLFFNSLVAGRSQPARAATRADYTFLNERLAQHYGIAGVVGAEFRRVTYPDATRRGILGQGTMLVQTLAGQPHLAGAARQVGDGSAARHAAAAAAAGRARSRSRRRRRRTAGC